MDMMSSGWLRLGVKKKTLFRGHTVNYHLCQRVKKIGSTSEYDKIYHPYIPFLFFMWVKQYIQANILIFLKIKWFIKVLVEENMKCGLG